MHEGGGAKPSGPPSPDWEETTEQPSSGRWHAPSEGRRGVVHRASVSWAASPCLGIFRTMARSGFHTIWVLYMYRSRQNIYKYNVIYNFETDYQTSQVYGSKPLIWDVINVRVLFRANYWHNWHKIKIYAPSSVPYALDGLEIRLVRSVVFAGSSIPAFDIMASVFAVIPTEVNGWL